MARKLVYIASSLFAVPPLRALMGANHQPVAVVTLPDRRAKRGNKQVATPVKQAAQELGLSIIETDRPGDDTVVQELRDLAPDFIVVCAYAKMIPGRLLKLPRYFCINIHPSLLPAWRGAAPISRALMAGEAVTGVSFFRMNKRLDAGAILYQESLPIAPEDDYLSLSEKLTALAAARLPDQLRQVAAGDYALERQDHSLACYAPAIDKAECRVDWRLQSTRIHNQVRGLNGYLPAFTLFRGKRMALLRTRDLGACGTARPAGTVEINQRRLTVHCGEGTCLDVRQVQMAGKKPVPAPDIVAGYRITTGERLG